MGQWRGGGREARLAVKFMCTSMVGFATDALLLHLWVSLGLGPAWARLISLTAAMQVTFLINFLFVFQGHDRAGWRRQWISYMLSNGFGNFCNYWIFVTLVSTHWPLISNQLFALSVGAFCAWIMNFASARFLVFGKSRWIREPAPGAATEKSRRALRRS